MGSLKTFIKSVRKSKTIASERATIRKESAHIRSSFRDPLMDNDRRNKNIQKLIYLYILGEPTHFGQVECLKLLSSPRIFDKRIGYMATMLIFDENQDILTLLTNSLDLDLKSTDMFVVNLALSALGNVASNELAKDLYPQVEKLLKSTLSFIKKKAVLVAAKLIEMEPTLSEIFLPYIPQLLNEKDHGVLLSTLYLIETIFKFDKSSHVDIFKSIPKVLTHLNFLISMGYSPDYDVKGVPDPFLLVSLLKTLRIIMVDINQENLEKFNDILTQVCAKFETTRGGPSHAILYECVKTIFSINSDSSLKILGVNILSKFLTQKDNNIKYVALNTLLNVIDYEPLAVQRHRTIIVACLNDMDISIRRRSIELIFGIMNKQNVKLLTAEIMKYLQKGDDDELKDYITNQLTINLIKFSNDDKKWLVLNLIAILKTCGNFCNDNVLSIILAKLIQSGQGDLIIKELIDLNKQLFDQYGLSLITIWCIGEYSNLIQESKLIDMIKLILEVSSFTVYQRDQIKLYSLNSMIKMSINVKTNSTELKRLIASFENDINLQVQIRSVEYLKIFNESMDVKIGLLEKIPAPPIKQYEDVNLMHNRFDNVEIGNDHEQQQILVNEEQAPKPTNNILMDLLGDDFGIKDLNPIKNDDKKQDKVDILSDLFGSMGTKTTNNIEIIDPESIEGFKDDYIRVGFIKKSNQSGKFQMEIIIKCLSGEISNLSILCAVPKSQKLQLTPLPKNSLKFPEFTQLRSEIEASTGSKIKMRVKVGYSTSSGPINRQFDFAGFNELVI